MAATLTPMEERTEVYTRRVKRSQEINDLRPSMEPTTMTAGGKRTEPAVCEQPDKAVGSAKKRSRGVTEDNREGYRGIDESNQGSTTERSLLDQGMREENSAPVTTQSIAQFQRVSHQQTENKKRTLEHEERRRQVARQTTQLQKEQSRKRITPADTEEIAAGDLELVATE